MFLFDRYKREVGVFRYTLRALIVPLSVLSVTLAPVMATGQALPRDAGDYVIVGGRLWVGTGDEAIANPGILIRNGTILQVGNFGAQYTDLPRIELTDEHFLMPGLFDLHAHYAVDLFGEGRVDEYTVNPVLFLANGVTSTFPAGEVDPAEARKGRERIASGEISGPRIYSSGPYWGTARPGWQHEAMTPDSIRIEGASWALNGAHGFKAKGILPDQLEAVIEVAHAHGLTVTAHLDSGFRNSVNPRDAILMGIDRIEHFLGGDALPATQSAYESLEALDLDHTLTATKIREQSKLFIEHGAFFDATLTAYGYFADREAAVYEYWEDEMGFLTPYARAIVDAGLPKTPSEQFGRIYRVKRETVKAFYDEGGADNLTLGTDHPSWGEFFSGFGSHRELHAMVLAGIPNPDALRAGTINAARAIGVDTRLGTIESGKYADLIVIEGDPLREITDTRNVRIVVKAGRVYDTKELLDGVRGAMGPLSSTDADWWKGNLRLGR